MDLDNPAYGDEREKAVFMEASSFGLTMGIYLSLALAVIASTVGYLIVAVALLAMTILPSAAAQWYAKQHGVDIRAMAENAGDRSTTRTFVILGAGMVLTFAAMAVTVFTGQPILPTPTLDVTPGEGFFGGMAQGAVVGGMLGGLAAIVGALVGYRRAAARRDSRG
ncbi:hypothetical protein [Marisediminicola sp. LYQ134]